jgi:hypothetical protein
MIHVIINPYFHLYLSRIPFKSFANSPTWSKWISIYGHLSIASVHTHLAKEWAGHAWSWQGFATYLSLSLYFNWIIIAPSPHLSSTFIYLWPTATVPLQCFFLLISFGEGRKEDSCMSWLRREGKPCSNPPLPVHQWLAPHALTR